MKERGPKLCRRLILYVLYKILHHEVSHACRGKVKPKKCTKRFDAREQNDYFCLGFVDTILDSFFCRYEKLSCIVWSPIGYVNLHFRDQLSSIVWTPLQYVNLHFRDQLSSIVWTPLQYVNLHFRDQLSSIVWTPLQYVNLHFRDQLSSIVWTPLQYVNLHFRDQLSSIMWTPLGYVNLYFRDRRCADSLRYRNCAKITVLMWTEALSFVPAQKLLSGIVWPLPLFSFFCYC